MVKFDILLKPEEAEPLQNRVVCDVTEYHTTVGNLPVAMWRGSVENEYFSIMFIRGILTVSISEREMTLGWNAVNYAMSSMLNGGIQLAGDNQVLRAEMEYNYASREGVKEAKQINFTDIMVALNWRYQERAKIYYDVLMDVVEVA